MDIFNTGGKSLVKTTADQEGKSRPKRYPRTALAYIAQLEHEYLARHKLTLCNHCLKLAINAPLKQCVACKLVDYCGRECQRADWRRHKGVCWMVQGRGERDAWLDGVLKSGGGSEGSQEAWDGVEAVYRRVIDAYRLRMVTDCKSRDERHGLFWGKTDETDETKDETEEKEKDGKEEKEKGSLVWAQGDVLADFQRWLDLCEEAGVLPDWWVWEDRMQCLLRAVDRGEQKDDGNDDDGSIYTIINQDALIQRYGNDTSIRNALGIFAELVVGYDGKGRATDDSWYVQFQEFMDLHPQERVRLIQGTIDAVEGVKGEHADLFAGKK